MQMSLWSPEGTEDVAWFQRSISDVASQPEPLPSPHVSQCSTGIATLD